MRNILLLVAARSHPSPAASSKRSWVCFKLISYICILWGVCFKLISYVCIFMGGVCFKLISYVCIFMCFKCEEKRKKGKIHFIWSVVLHNSAYNAVWEVDQGCAVDSPLTQQKLFLGNRRKSYTLNSNEKFCFNKSFSTETDEKVWHWTEMRTLIPTLTVLIFGTQVKAATTSPR